MLIKLITRMFGRPVLEPEPVQEPPYGMTPERIHELVEEAAQHTGTTITSFEYPQEKP